MTIRSMQEGFLPGVKLVGSDMICEKYIQPFAKNFSELSIYNSVSERSKNNLDNWSGSVGFIHELVEKVLNVRAPEFEFYAAGPPAMNDSLVRLLQLKRFQK